MMIPALPCCPPEAQSTVASTHQSGHLGRKSTFGRIT
jgi:hypothetical protein